jgi:hypothetical protein
MSRKIPNKNIERIKTPYLGKKQGRLLVSEVLISSAGDTDKRRGLYKCICDCGKEIEVKGVQIKLGKCSCGCLQYEARFGTSYRHRRPDRATYTVQYHNHNRSARSKGFIPLSQDIWKQFVIQPCYYCGEVDKRNTMTQNCNRKKFIDGITDEEIAMYEVPCNGIDRVDSKKGYEVDNCVPCCMQCNYMKIEYPQDSFYRKVEMIHTRKIYRDIPIESFLCN